MANETFLGELAEVARIVQQVIRDDRFPRDLVPDELRAGVLAYPLRGGKMLRPALLRWSCGLFGPNPNQANYAAAAVELFHTWTLVHDDIIDRDDLRRGAPSVHALLRDQLRQTGLAPEVAARYGVDFAILVGDVQQAWANALLLRSVDLGVPACVVLALARRLNEEVNPGLLAGEALDVQFELRPFASISPGEMERMLRLKTGLLLRYAAESGAMIGLETAEATDPRVRLLGDFAADAGLAFQLKDDLLGMFGDEAALGKPVGSDLRRGKRTMLFAEALARLDVGGRQTLLAALGNPELTSAESRGLGALLVDCGAVAAVEQRARDLIEAALARLASLPDNRYRELLREWARFVYDRNR